MREAAFNELHRSFQRDAGMGSQQEVNVVGLITIFSYRERGIFQLYEFVSSNILAAGSD
jgi:hypothetical protein